MGIITQALAGSFREGPMNLFLLSVLVFHRELATSQNEFLLAILEIDHISTCFRLQR